MWGEERVLGLVGWVWGGCPMPGESVFGREVLGVVSVLGGILSRVGRGSEVWWVCVWCGGCPYV